MRLNMNTGIILDVGVVVIIALSVLLGYRKGFVNLAISLIALVLSILVTAVLYNPITNLVINTTSIDETLENHIYEKVIQKMENGDSKQVNYLGITAEQTQEGMLPIAARELSINIIRFAVFLILFIGLKIAVRCISALANLIAKIPLIKQFNAFGGILYGLIRGFVIVFVGLMIIQFVTNIEPNNKAYQYIEKSYITKPLYDNNIINIIFK